MATAIAVTLVALCSLACSTEAATDGASSAVSGADDPVAGLTPPPTSDVVDPTDESAVPGREVPPLVLPSQAPGTDQAWAELRTSLERFVHPDQLAEIPWPDLRKADPVAVYQSCAEYQNWMAANNPSPPLVEAYTAPASPERASDSVMFDRWAALDARWTDSDPPYSMRIEGVVHPAATEISDRLLAEVPDGAVAVVYYDTLGRTEIIGPGGEVLEVLPGWSDEGPWVAIMAPTDVGWQVWWDELTETPPPGLDARRGPPATPPGRADV